jgi:hypothetical protein
VRRAHRAVAQPEFASQRLRDCRLDGPVVAVGVGGELYRHLPKPDHNNYSKRLVETPKLYFYDTGLACSLLEIRSAEQVSSHFLRGGLFENMVVNEFIKNALNCGEEPELTFWRDKTGNEVDLRRDVFAGLFRKSRAVGTVICGYTGAMQRGLWR